MTGEIIALRVPLPFASFALYPRARDHRESTHVRFAGACIDRRGPGSLTVNCPVINHYGHPGPFRTYLRGGRLSRAGRPRGRSATIQGCRSAFTPDPSGSFSDPPDGPLQRPNNHGLEAGGIDARVSVFLGWFSFFFLFFWSVQPMLNVLLPTGAKQEV